MSTPTAVLFEDDMDQHDARELRLLALGGVLKAARTRNGWSVEQAGLHAGIGHMTWRRAERGEAARRTTYAAIEQLFELPLNTINGATKDDAKLLELAHRLGVEPETTDPAELVQKAASASVRAKPVVAAATLGPLTAHAAGTAHNPTVSTRSDVASVVDVLAMLRSWGPAAQNVEAIKALTEALQNHLIDPTQHKVTTATGPDGAWMVHVEPIEQGE